MSLGQLKVMSAIERCRTAALGGYVARCENDACGHTVIAYNSCRNRHCPKCQGAAAREWLAEREAELLPVPYFHVVYTLPAPIADIAYHNKAVIYDLLFKVSAETTLTIAADPKRLGARIAITSVLHTWGSAMTHHPHVHMIVPGGGLSPDGSRWIACRRDYFLPVEVLSALFRRRCCRASGRRTRPASCNLLRRSRWPRRRQGVRRVPEAVAQGRLGRLRQGAFRRSKGGAADTVGAHALCRDLEPPPDRRRRAWRHLQIQGLPPRRARPLHDDDARPARVHPAVPDARAAQGPAPHSALRPPRQHNRAANIAKVRELLSVAPPSKEPESSKAAAADQACARPPAPAAVLVCSSSSSSRPAASPSTGRARPRRPSGSTRHDGAEIRPSNTAHACCRLPAGHAGARPNAGNQHRSCIRDWRRPARRPAIAPIARLSSTIDGLADTRAISRASPGVKSP